MAVKNKLKAGAEIMFIEKGMTAKAIAETLEIREATVGKWRKDGNWDAMRDENIAAPHKIRQTLLQEMKKISAGEKSNLDADALAKISKVMDTLSARTSPQVVITVIKALDNFMAKHDPQLAIQCLDLHKKFIQNAIGSNGL